jgi:hypothetical protein
MEVEEQIIRELHQVPRQRHHEILDFIRSVQKKHRNGITYASGSSLRKDWLRPEEDEAWANL